jgi:hypothetical protein
MHALTRAPRRRVSLTLHNFRHPFAGDVSLWLVAPSGAFSALTTGACDGAWFGGPPTGDATMAGATYTWDDAASPAETADTYCTTQLPPSTRGPTIAAGAYLPETPLAALAGAAASGDWVLTFGDSAVGDVGYFDRAVLSLTHAADSAVWSYDLTVTTTISVMPTGNLVPVFPAVNSNGVRTGPTPRYAAELRAGPPTSTCANTAAGSCPQSQCYGASSCCLASGDCGNSGTNVCDEINLLLPSGATSTKCNTAVGCKNSSSFPSASAVSPAPNHPSSITDGCTCPSAVASCTNNKCWGALRCDNRTTSSCTTTGMCLGNSAGGRVNTAPVGWFCVQNGASNTFKFCPTVSNTQYNTSSYNYEPRADGQPDSFGFKIAPAGGCTPTFSYTQLLRVASLSPPPAAPAGPKLCGPRDIQSVVLSPNPTMRMLYLNDGRSADPVDLNVSFILPPDSRREAAAMLWCAAREACALVTLTLRVLRAQRLAELLR